MKSRYLAGLVAIAAIAAAACTQDSFTSPATGARALASNGQPPGSGVRGSAWTRARANNCIPAEGATGTASIGPSGGELLIGTHRLIIPPGALKETVEISGTVPAGRPFEIDLQPHGLQFKKAAGLILDASSCTEVPTIVYLIDQFTVSEPIVGVYSNWWHTIACPIWHFSGYAIAFGRVDEESGVNEGDAR